MQAIHALTKAGDHNNKLWKVLLTVLRKSMKTWLRESPELLGAALHHLALAGESFTHTVLIRSF